MPPKVFLKFSFVPDSVVVGEPFSLSVQLVDAEGNDVDPHVVQDIDSAVAIALEDGVDGLLGPSDESTTAPLSFGEAYFDGVVLAKTSVSDVRFKATAMGFEAALSDAVSVQRSGDDAAVPDESLADVCDLISRLKSAKGAKVKHFLMLLRGRMWGQEGNAEKLVASDAVAVINNVLTKCDADEAIECVALVQQILTNTDGHAMMSCGSCRAMIDPVALANPKTIIIRAPNGVVFHASCLLCKQCNAPLGTTAFVRDDADRPLHVKCAPVAMQSHPSLVCTVVAVENRHESVNVAARHFVESGAMARFSELLKSRHLKDEYVRDRVQRMLTAVSHSAPAVHKQLEALLM